MDWIMHTSPSGEKDLSLAFQDVALIICPAIYVIITALSKNKSANNSRAFNDGRIVNLVFLWFLSALTLICLVLYSILSPVGGASSSITISTQTLRFATSLLFFIGSCSNRNDLKHPLGLWTITLLVSGGVKLHTLCRMLFLTSHNKKEIILGWLEAALVVLCFFFIILQTIISPPFYLSLKCHRQDKMLNQQMRLSEDNTSALGSIFFLWLSPLLKMGNHIESEIKNADISAKSPISISQLPNTHELLKRLNQFSRLLPLFNTNKAALIILSVLLAGIQLCQPIVIQALIRFINGNADPSVGRWLIVALSLNFIALPLLTAHRAQQALRLSYHTRANLIQRIFTCAVSMGLQATTPPTSADSSQVAVLVSVDTMNIQTCIEVLFECLTSTIVIGVGSYMLYRQIGVAFVGPLILASAATGIPFLLSKKLQMKQGVSLKATEKRIKATNDVILNARAVRLESMEQTAFDVIRRARKLEIDCTAMYRRVDILILLAASSVSSLCILISFALFPVTREAEKLDYSILFSSLSILSIMVTPLMSTLQMLPIVVQGWVSFKRILGFLNTGEHRHITEPLEATSDANTPPDESTATTESQGNGVERIQLDNSILHWNSDGNIWNDFCLTLQPGDVVVLSGPSGSGKSRLIRSIIQTGQFTPYTENSLPRKCKLAFCDQNPWFLADLSIRENITFGKEWNMNLYSIVIACCCLEHEIAVFPEGDAKIIHDSPGTCLSGGQRRRVALARALYREPILLVLDDVFSGLDSQTEAKIQRNLFGDNGFISLRPYMAVIITSLKVILQKPGTITIKLQMGHISFEEPFDRPQKKVPSNIQMAQHSTGSSVEEHEHETQVMYREVQEDNNEENRLIEQSVYAARNIDEYATYIGDLGGTIAFIPIMVLLLVYTGLEKGGPFWLSYWASQFETQHPPRKSAVYYVGVYAGLIAIGVLSLVGASWAYFMRMVPRSGIRIHEQMLTALLNSSIYVIQKTSSEILNRFTKDAETVDLMLPQSLQNFIFERLIFPLLPLAFFSVLGSIMVLAIPSPYMLLTFVVLLPLLYLVKCRYLPISNQLRNYSIASQTPMLSTIISSVSGRDSILAFGMLSQLAEIMAKQTYAAQKSGYLFRSLQTGLRLFLGLTNACIISAFAILLVEIKAKRQTSSNAVGWAGVALVNAINLGSNFALLMNWWIGLEASMGSIRRIMEYTQSHPTEHRVEDTIQKEGHGNKIQISDLTIFHGSMKAIDHLSLGIPAGQKVAIIGRTGSGKSTLMDALLHLVNLPKGQAFLDGVDFTTLSTIAVQKKITSLAQQSFFVTSETLKHNIDPSGDVTCQEIERYLELITDTSTASQIMSKLHNKWSHCEFPSQWQRQIAIARMLLKRSAEIYIMDEPTTGFDNETHRHTLEAILALLEEKTVIVITHNLCDVEKFDQIFVLQSGILVEKGHPKKLLQESGTFLSQLVTEAKLLGK